MTCATIKLTQSKRGRIHWIVSYLLWPMFLSICLISSSSNNFTCCNKILYCYWWFECNAIHDSTGLFDQRIELYIKFSCAANTSLILSTCSSQKAKDQISALPATLFTMVGQISPQSRNTLVSEINTKCSRPIDCLTG